MLDSDLGTRAGPSMPVWADGRTSDRAAIVHWPIAVNAFVDWSSPGRTDDATGFDQPAATRRLGGRSGDEPTVEGTWINSTDPNRSPLDR